jgi:hypothetical protein
MQKRKPCNPCAQKRINHKINNDTEYVKINSFRNLCWVGEEHCDLSNQIHELKRFRKFAVSKQEPIFYSYTYAIKFQDNWHKKHRTQHVIEQTFSMNKPRDKEAIYWRGVCKN